jgi:hypothetical protein
MKMKREARLVSSCRTSKGDRDAYWALAGEDAAGLLNKRLGPTTFSICGTIAATGRRGSRAGSIGSR